MLNGSIGDGGSSPRTSTYPEPAGGQLAEKSGYYFSTPNPVEHEKFALPGQTTISGNNPDPGSNSVSATTMLSETQKQISDLVDAVVALVEGNGGQDGEEQANKAHLGHLTSHVNHLIYLGKQVETPEEQSEYARVVCDTLKTLDKTELFKIPKQASVSTSGLPVPLGKEHQQLRQAISKLEKTLIQSSPTKYPELVKIINDPTKFNLAHIGVLTPELRFNLFEQTVSLVDDLSTLSETPYLTSECIISFEDYTSKLKQLAKWILTDCAIPNNTEGRSIFEGIGHTHTQQIITCLSEITKQPSPLKINWLVSILNVLLTQCVEKEAGSKHTEKPFTIVDTALSQIKQLILDHLPIDSKIYTPNPINELAKIYLQISSGEINKLATLKDKIAIKQILDTLIPGNAPGAVVLSIIFMVLDNPNIISNLLQHDLGKSLFDKFNEWWKQIELNYPDSTEIKNKTTTTQPDNTKPTLKTNNSIQIANTLRKGVTSTTSGIQMNMQEYLKRCGRQLKNLESGLKLRQEITDLITQITSKSLPKSNNLLELLSSLAEKHPTILSKSLQEIIQSLEREPQNGEDEFSLLRSKLADFIVTIENNNNENKKFRIITDDMRKFSKTTKETQHQRNISKIQQLCNSSNWEQAIDILNNLLKDTSSNSHSTYIFIVEMRKYLAKQDANKDTHPKIDEIKNLLVTYLLTNDYFVNTIILDSDRSSTAEGSIEKLFNADIIKYLQKQLSDWQASTSKDAKEINNILSNCKLLLESSIKYSLDELSVIEALIDSIVLKAAPQDPLMMTTNINLIQQQIKHKIHDKKISIILDNAITKREPPYKILEETLNHLILYIEDATKRDTFKAHEALEKLNVFLDPILCEAQLDKAQSQKIRKLLGSVVSAMEHLFAKNPTIENMLFLRSISSDLSKLGIQYNDMVANILQTIINSTNNNIQIIARNLYNIINIDIESLPTPSHIDNLPKEWIITINKIKLSKLDETTKNNLLGEISNKLKQAIGKQSNRHLLESRLDNLIKSNSSFYNPFSAIAGFFRRIFGNQPKTQQIAEPKTTPSTTKEHITTEPSITAATAQQIAELETKLNDMLTQLTALQEKVSATGQGIDQLVPICEMTQQLHELYTDFPLILNDDLSTDPLVIATQKIGRDISKLLSEQINRTPPSTKDGIMIIKQIVKLGSLSPAKKPSVSYLFDDLLRDTKLVNQLIENADFNTLSGEDLAVLLEHASASEYDKIKEKLKALPDNTTKKLELISHTLDFVRKTSVSKIVRKTRVSKIVRKTRVSKTSGSGLPTYIDDAVEAIISDQSVTSNQQLAKYVKPLREYHVNRLLLQIKTSSNSTKLETLLDKVIEVIKASPNQDGQEYSIERFTDICEKIQQLDELYNILSSVSSNKYPSNLETMLNNAHRILSELLQHIDQNPSIKDGIIVIEQIVKLSDLSSPKIINKILAPILKERRLPNLADKLIEKADFNTLSGRDLAVLLEHVSESSYNKIEEKLKALPDNTTKKLELIAHTLDFVRKTSSFKTDSPNLQEYINKTVKAIIGNNTITGNQQLTQYVKPLRAYHVNRLLLQIKDSSTPTEELKRLLDEVIEVIKTAPNQEHSELVHLILDKNILFAFLQNGILTKLITLLEKINNDRKSNTTAATSIIKKTKSDTTVTTPITDTTSSETLPKPQRVAFLAPTAPVQLFSMDSLTAELAILNKTQECVTTIDTLLNNNNPDAGSITRIFETLINANIPNDHTRVIVRHIVHKIATYNISGIDNQRLMLLQQLIIKHFIENENLGNEQKKTTEIQELSSIFISEIFLITETTRPRITKPIIARADVILCKAYCMNNKELNQNDLRYIISTVYKYCLKWEEIPCGMAKTPKIDDDTKKDIIEIIKYLRKNKYNDALRQLEAVLNQRLQPMPQEIKNALDATITV